MVYFRSLWALLLILILLCQCSARSKEQSEEFKISAL